MQISKPTEHIKHSQDSLLPAQELQDTKQLVNVLLLAWKSYCLYPERHAASIKALENLESAFNVFFSTHSDLRLSVKKDSLLCESETLHEVSSDTPSEDIVSLLYRDGIQWLEFRQGLRQEELTSFFNILNKYRELEEETEGDIVTGLIDGNLEHINIKAVDTFWQDVPLIDFSNFNPSLPETEDSAKHIEPEKTEQQEGPRRNDISTKSIADPSISEELWEISPAEYEELQKMVLEEENWDNTEDIFDVLLVILGSQTDQYNFSSVLDFTLEEVAEAIEQEEYGLLLNLFQSLHQLLYRDASDEHDWVRLLIEGFFQDLSSSKIFDLITGKLMLLNDSDTEKIQALRQILLFLSPTGILSLGPILIQTRSSAVRKMILEAIEYLCLRDLEPLEKLLDSPEKELGESLLPVLSRLKKERTNKIFFKMTEHPSAKVRKEGIRVLLVRDPFFVQKLFFLIDDPRKEIRKDIFAGIAMQRSSVLENMLLKYIKENFDKKDSAHILACYEALGRCGSAAATPFLRRILLDQGWNWFKGYGKLIHREGAATALALLDTRAAKNILQTASKSKFKVVREAFDKAMAKIDASGEDSNG